MATPHPHLPAGPAPIVVILPVLDEAATLHGLEIDIVLDEDDEPEKIYINRSVAAANALDPPELHAPPPPIPTPAQSNPRLEAAESPKQAARPAPTAAAPSTSTTAGRRYRDRQPVRIGAEAERRSAGRDTGTRGRRRAGQ